MMLDKALFIAFVLMGICLCACFIWISKCFDEQQAQINRLKSEIHELYLSVGRMVKIR